MTLAELTPFLPAAVAAALLGAGMLGGALMPAARRRFELGFSLLAVLVLGGLAVAAAIDGMQSGSWPRAALTLALFLVVALFVRHRAMKLHTTGESGS